MIQARDVKVVLVLAGALLCFLSLLTDSVWNSSLFMYFQPCSENPSYELDESSAGKAAGLSPVTTTNDSSESSNVTVSVFIRPRGLNYPQSFFMNHMLSRYGKLAYKYELINFEKEGAVLGQKATATPYCILVEHWSRVNNIRDERTSHCYIIQIADEFCKSSSNSTQCQARFYYDERVPQTPYLPLGPRVDFWEVYTRHNISTAPILPPSKRSYFYNAIFSENTSPSRKDLANHLNAHPRSDAVVNINKRWQSKLDPNKAILQPQYMEILSQSIFTLSPTGHNPESFRLFEAAIMGSVPIVALDETYTNHACRNAFAPLSANNMEDVPFVFLDNWTMLEPTLDDMFAMVNGKPTDRTAPLLDAYQTKLLKWYHPMMKRLVTSFEAKFLEYCKVFKDR